MSVSWEEINWAIKYTLLHFKHLELDDLYLIEKATDDCFLYIKQKLLYGNNKKGEKGIGRNLSR
jgi:hypothetical protein